MHALLTSPSHGSCHTAHVLQGSHLVGVRFPPALLPEVVLHLQSAQAMAEAAAAAAAAFGLMGGMMVRTLAVMPQCLSAHRT